MSVARGPSGSVPSALVPHALAGGVQGNPADGLAVGDNSVCSLPGSRRDYTEGTTPVNLGMVGREPIQPMGR